MPVRVAINDLVVEAERTTTVDEIKAAMKRTAAGSLKGVLEYFEKRPVSKDFTGHSTTAVDATSTTVVGKKTGASCCRVRQ